MNYNKNKLIFPAVTIFILSAAIIFREAESFDFGKVFEALTEQFNTDLMDFLGHECQYNTSPTLRKWNLYWSTTIRCPGVASFSGRGLTRSRSGSLDQATKDFAKKALDGGLFTREQLKSWI